ncbi:hypothetical protein SteCoe_34503 [Stentor coeruleus]|uniref:Uncharacterized protein n=1 Tax=Stentor coeruleus TaxID=5963 RepID=A0A1R2AUE4_9CILI|nr:hypothetical protein SteCoe_34503 [Stentor coeruleus]
MILYQILLVSIAGLKILLVILCWIENITNTTLAIKINSEGTYAFRLAKSEGSRTIWAPIAIMSGLIGFFFLGVIIGLFNISKKEASYQKSQENIFVLFLLTSSLFRKQSFSHRVSTLFQFISCQLFLLSVLGCVYLIFDDPFNITDFASYQVEHLKYAAIALAFCQCYSIPIFILYCKALNQLGLFYMHCAICLCVSFASVACICILNIYYCYDVIIDWIINYFISAVLEIGIEGFIAFIGSRIFRKHKQRIDETFDKSLDKSIDKSIDNSLDYNKGEKNSVILNTNISRLDFANQVIDSNECDYEIVADYKQGELITVGRIDMTPDNKLALKETKNKQIAEESKVKKGDLDSDCDYEIVAD